MPVTADGLVEALHVSGPVGPNAEQLELFGQFIGSWDVAWSGLDAALALHRQHAPFRSRGAARSPAIAAPPGCSKRG
jgi:hypothetical protein